MRGFDPLPSRCAMAIAVFVAIGCSLAIDDAAAQLHQQAFGPYTVRANVIGSLALEPAIARRHDIVPSRDRAVLNIVVVPSGGVAPRGMTARIDAHVTPGGSATHHVTMREVVENESVSYVGDFEATPGTTVAVTLEVEPRGARRTFEMRFVDELPLR
jgi:hypothetical protein